MTREKRSADLPKVARIGIRVPAATPGMTILPGYKSAIYDVDTGVLLPAQDVDLHLDAKKIATATVTLLVSEVTVGELPESGDG